MALSHRFEPLFFSDKRALADSIRAAAARLDYISTNISSASLDQVKTAIGNIADYEKKLIKFVAGTVQV